MSLAEKWEWPITVCTLVLLTWLMNAAAEIRPPEQGGRTALEAVSAAQVIVEGKLRAPSTAKFVRDQCSAAPTADGKWEAVIVVDAQSGFGAMLRNRYVVELWPKYQGSDDWQGRILSGD